MYIFSSLRSKSEYHPETAPSETAFQPHPSHHSSADMVAPPSNSIVDHSSVKIQRHMRAQSLTQGPSQHSDLHSTRLATLPSPNNFSPTKTIQDSPTQSTQDTDEDYLYAENRTSKMSPIETKSKSDMDLSFNSNSSINHNRNKQNTKSTPPQRPPPPKVKVLNSTKEANISQNSTACGQKVPTNWKNNTMWSSSSSESETPSHHGKISLRISESGLQLSALVGNDDVEDEVFVKDQEVGTSPKIHFVPPSPPPFPPPTLEDAILKEKEEKIHTLLATPPKNYEGNVRKDWKEM